MRLRQVALVAEHLGSAAADLEAVLGIEVGFRDPGVALFGLENVVMPIGDTFLEVVSPVKEDTTAGRLLARRGGDGGYMVILQTDDLESDRQRVSKLGVRVVFEINQESAQGIHLHPADTSGALLSLDRPDPPESWVAAGLDWRDHVRTQVVSELRCAELQSDAPERLGARWSEVLGRPLEGGEIVLERGRLRFVHAEDGHPEGLAGVEISAADRSRSGEAFELCGVRFRLV